MATVQSHMNGFDPVLEDLPAWKKELILRRRANAKFHGETTIHSGGKVASPQSPHSPTSVQPQHILSCLGQGQSQLSVCSLQGGKGYVRTARAHNNVSSQSSSNVSVVKRCSVHRENCACLVSKDYDCSITDLKPPTADSMRGPATMHHKGLPPPRDTLKKDGNLCKSEEEEFEYGPGIVSRLKNRYLSLALREAKGRASLRKYSSLEDLLDDGGQERGRSTEKERPVARGNIHKDSMKRARSMDSLSFRRNDYGDRVSKSHSSGALRNALEKKEIIIIENIRPKDNNKNSKTSNSKEFENSGRKLHHQSSLLEEEELPAPDTVKQVKQIFESSGRVSKGTAAAKAASYKAAHAQKYPAIYPKPPIKVKPTQIQCKTISPTIESAKSSLKQVQPVIRSSPRSVLSVKATPPPILKAGISSPLSPKISGLTPISSSVTSPQVNGEKSPPLIHKEENYKGSEQPFSSSRQETHPRPHSPPPSLLPLSPTPAHKANSSESGKSENEETSKETERVLQENRKNKEKSGITLSESRSPPPKIFKPHAPVVPMTVESPTEKTDEVGPAKLLSKEGECNKHREISANETQAEKKECINGSNSASETSSYAPPPVENKAVQSNSQPSSSSSVMEVIRAAEAKSTSSSPSPAPPAGVSPMGLRTTTTARRDARRNSNENSPLVFNFSKRSETPDYIENDGVDLSKRQFKYKHESGYVIMPGYDGKLDSSTDGDDEGIDDSLDAAPRNGVPPPPCNICFEGEGVIINGRSNLQRQPRTKKLEVSFDMPSTSTFEYPSENVLVDEFDLKEASENVSAAEISSSSLPLNATPSSGGLASYTPSKLKLNESFELGVSRSATPQPPTPPRGKESLEEELNHVRPADESQTVTWSSENAPDILF